VPSPFADDPDLGLAFHHLPEAAYDRGGSRTNREEAKRVAEAVLAHARARPDLSLGVGCFSIAQRDAVLAELERLWRAAPELRRFFREDGAEPFFVKNLETIQGDERDVILISIGYGRDASGHLALAFGPLSAEGGERRLNVLITRARRRLEVFSAITAADIDLAGKPGVAALKAFLQYAESGVLGVSETSGRGPDSLFEAEVARALEGQGHRVDLQVGVAGFFVDLAVCDPERPGRWLLGIECDGAAWHSALSARDRDRLRQQVLEDQGWIIHRIWSTEWYRRPEAEQRRLGQAIAAARGTWERRDRELRDRAARAPDENASGRAALAAVDAA
jgi:very-short-patch-repair endonuclease